MHTEFSAHTPRPAFKRPAPIPSVRLRRWSIPLLAIAVGAYGYTRLGAMQADSPYQVTNQLAEEERLRKNAQLMEAYGYKDNVDDLQKALEAYEVQ
ncbi:hypothetical protein BDW74DRAFT_20732 [Aspergillus multicolor]|uniref:uncharacterized protein n=1 Tax=Aspergillus multicolor TaxID=41759 RepID=UPI003CCC96B6